MAVALVTGAAGAVGSVVARRLRDEGYEVRAMVRRAGSARIEGAREVVADLGDPAALAAAARGADVCVHCAAVISADLDECRRMNVDGTRDLIDALGGARLVHISTVSVYDLRGTQPGEEIDERAPAAASPKFAYGRSKADAEALVLATGAATILRPAIVLSLHASSYWGPLARARARLARQPIYGAVDLPYVHADNLATAALLALRAPAAAGGIYNVVDGHGPAADYLAAVGSPPLPPNAPSLRISGAKLRRELGYAPPDRWAEFLAQLAGL